MDWRICFLRALEGHLFFCPFLLALLPCGCLLGLHWVGCWVWGWVWLRWPMCFRLLGLRLWRPCGLVAALPICCLLVALLHLHPGAFCLGCCCPTLLPLGMRGSWCCWLHFPLCLYLLGLWGGGWGYSQLG